MEPTTKCLNALDYSGNWQDWRQVLHNVIANSRTYYEDETVQNLLTKLNIFLDQEVCRASEEEQFLQEMWAVADESERKVITKLLLRLSSR